MRRIVCLLGATVLALMLASGVALAAFPGDNGKVAFVRSDGQDDEIYTAYPDGSDEVQLTDNSADDDQPAFSADGRRLAFESDRTGTDLLYVMSANGANVRQLTDTASYDPAFSPDGRKIVYVREVGEGTDLYVKNAAGTGTKRLTRTALEETEPDWAPGGKRIAFVRDGPKAGTSILSITPQGTGEKRLLDGRYKWWDEGAVYYYDPDYSPDGKRLVYTELVYALYGDEEYYDVKVLRLGTDRPPVIVASGHIDYYEENPTMGSFAYVGEPAFSPDGTKVAFEADTYAPPEQPWQSYTLDPGTYVKNSNGAGSGYEIADGGQAPDWQPVP